MTIPPEYLVYDWTTNPLGLVVPRGEVSTWATNTTDAEPAPASETFFSTEHPPSEEGTYSNFASGPTILENIQRAIRDLERWSGRSSTISRLRAVVADRARQHGVAMFLAEDRANATVTLNVWVSKPTVDAFEIVRALCGDLQTGLPVTVQLRSQWCLSSGPYDHPVLGHCVEHSDCREHPELGRECWLSTHPEGGHGSISVGASSKA